MNELYGAAGFVESRPVAGSETLSFGLAAAS